MSEQLATERRGATHLARLSGEIDLSNARELEEAVLAGAGDADALVVDLSQVTYFDSCGLRMLNALAGACDRAALRLSVVAPDASPARMVLRIVAWPAELLAASLDEALAG